jgi:ATP-dependent RNA helicase DDX54/DBP10
MRDGETFAEQAKHATFDLAGDEGVSAQKRARSKMTWDKRKKKFVHGDGAGADNVKMVTTESGVKLPATYRSGRFDEWSAKARMSLPRVGDVEPERRVPDRKRFKHNSTTAAKPLDKLATNYERKARFQKKAEAASTDAGGDGSAKKAHYNVKEPKNRYRGKSVGRVRSEIKSVEQIRKTRKTVNKRKEKNARPSRKKGKR